MRVGLLVSSLSGGGAERQAAVWAGICHRAGHEVKVLTLHGTGAPFALPDGVGVELAGKRGRADLGRLTRVVRRWANGLDVAVAFQPYAALLCWSARPAAPWLVVTGDDPRHHWVGPLNRRSSDVTRHNPDVTRFPRPLLRRALAAAALASAPTPGVVECYRRLGVEPRGGWFAIPNAVDDDAFVEGPPHRARALFVGRLIPQKDPLLALEVAAMANVPLTVLGDGPLKPELRRRAAEAAAEVTFAGFTPGPWEVYAAHRVLLVTSRSETFGNVMVEALAAGTPVVAGDCDFGPRVILEGTRYSRVVERAVEPLAAALAEVVGAGHDRAVAEECRAVARRYTAAAIAPQVEAALAAAAATGRRPRVQR